MANFTGSGISNQGVINERYCIPSSDPSSCHSPYNGASSTTNGLDLNGAGAWVVSSHQDLQFKSSPFYEIDTLLRGVQECEGVLTIGQAIKETTETKLNIAVLTLIFLSSSHAAV